MTQQKELTIDEILLIPTGDWTPEQTERVKKAIADGELTISRPEWAPPAFPFEPAPVFPSPPATPIVPSTGTPWWDLLGKGYITTDRTQTDDCSIRRYFQDNPDKTYVHMVCSCRLCTIHC